MSTQGGLAWLLPWATLLALTEGFAFTYAFKKNYDWKSSFTSYGSKLIQTLSHAVPLSIHVPFFNLAREYKLFNISLNNENSLVNYSLIFLLFIGVEFCYYWFHRASHKIQFFWLNHVVHHSSIDFNLSASFRSGFFSKFSGTQLFYLPLIWIGFDPALVFKILSAGLFYQFCIHNTWVPRLGWLEGIINTPSSHRVHHAFNAPYINSNYGSVLIIFDILFGTYVPEKKVIACEYGLTTKIQSYNPFVLELTGWKKLFGDLFRTRSFKSGLKILFGPP